MVKWYFYAQNQGGKMNYTDFLQELAVDLQDEFKHRNRNVDVEIIDVTKPWGWEIGLRVSDGRDMCPILYPDKQYEYYQAGMNYLMILSLFVKEIEAALDELPERHGFNLMSLKENVSLQLINTERSRNYLEGKVHREIEDLSLIYRFNVELVNGRNGSFVVTEDMLKLMGLNEEELYHYAMERAPLNNPCQIKTISTVIREITDEDYEIEGECPLLVLTNYDALYGASVIMYPDVLERCANVINGDFYVIPSSVHECLLQPDDGDISLSELKTIVKEVNDTQILPEELLSYSVYHYDHKEKIFELGEKYQQRMDEKNKHSVLEGLKSKQKSVDDNGHPRKTQDLGTRRNYGLSL